MKIYQISYDCICITIKCKDFNDLLFYLKESDTNFNFIDDKILYDWGNDFKEICQIDDISNKLDIIHIESH